MLVGFIQELSMALVSKEKAELDEFEVKKAVCNINKEISETIFLGRFLLQ